MTHLPCALTRRIREMSVTVAAASSTRTGLGTNACSFGREGTLAYALTDILFGCEQSGRATLSDCAHVLWHAGFGNAVHLRRGGPSQWSAWLQRVTHHCASLRAAAAWRPHSVGRGVALGDLTAAAQPARQR
jgi:hypothetical protein